MILIMGFRLYEDRKQAKLIDRQCLNSGTRLSACLLQNVTIINIGWYVSPGDFNF